MDLLSLVGSDKKDSNQNRGVPQIPALDDKSVAIAPLCSTVVAAQERYWCRPSAPLWDCYLRSTCITHTDAHTHTSALNAT